MISKRSSVFLSLTVFAIAVASNSCTKGFPVSDPVKVVEEHDIAGLNRPLEENVLTVDIVMFHSDNTEVTWDELKEEFTTADDIFRSYGVQLNLIEAYEVSFPPSWEGMASGEGSNVPTDDMDFDFYEMMNFEQEILPERLENILSSFIPDEVESDHTVFIIPLSGLTVAWYERDENNAWTKVTSPTSAISFPPYLFADRIPKHLSGVISFQRSHANRRVLAHELGHKLINVSHEGLDVCPQGSGTDVPGLMGYGESIEIFGGREGRWHQERLLKSPFLYRMVDGEKVWNQEYRNGGGYDDPIYDGLLMQPACP